MPTSMSTDPHGPRRPLERLHRYLGNVHDIKIEQTKKLDEL